MRRTPINYDTLIAQLRRMGLGRIRTGDVVSEYMALPALVALWPMNAIKGNSKATHLATDIAGGNDLLAATDTGQTVVQVSENTTLPYTRFSGGSSAYYSTSSVDDFEITGTESYVQNPYRGLTMGAWVKLDAGGTGTGRSIMGRWLLAGNERAYVLQVNSSGTLGFFISNNGANNEGAAHGISASEWYLCVGRYDSAATEVSLWVDGVKEDTNSSAGSSIATSTSDFYIGWGNSGTSAWDGTISLAFLCASALPDEHIKSIYNISRGLFGK